MINKTLVALQNFINKEALSGVLLFVATLLALVVANSSFGSEYFKLWDMPLALSLGEFSISMSVNAWIDDGLMALFFLMVGLEIKREVLAGELSSVGKASFPIVAAVGGMVVPALIYVSLNLQNPFGFGIPMATDIAFALGLLMLLGKRVNPALKLFLVALAVVDDLGAVMVVATVYTSKIHAIYFIHAIAIYAFIWILNTKGVTKLTPYLVLGVLLWVYIHAIGIHATIAGVLLAFAVPIRSKINEKSFVVKISTALQIFKESSNGSKLLSHDQIDSLESMAYGYEKVQNPLLRLEHSLHGLCAFFIMPLFAFSNAGVIIDFSSANEHLNIVLGVILGLVLGKPLGIVGFTYIFDKLGISVKPENISWFEILCIGFIAGIGFTMSIFITHLAFLDKDIISAVKLGVFIASFLASIIGVVMLLLVSKKG